MAEALPEDAERLVASMRLEPTVRDRTLLLIERSRMLVERAAEQAAESDQLRAAAGRHRDRGQPQRNAVADARDATLDRREAIADDRDSTLDRRDAAADARDATLDGREAVTEVREGALDYREAMADTRDTRLGRREAVVDERETALWEQSLSDLAFRRQLLAAVDGAWRQASSVADPLAQPARFEGAVFGAVVGHLDGLLPAMLDQVVGEWVGHARHELLQPLAVIAATIETLGASEGIVDEETSRTLLARAHRQAQLMHRARVDPSG